MFGQIWVMLMVVFLKLGSDDMDLLGHMVHIFVNLSHFLLCNMANELQDISGRLCLFFAKRGIV